MIPGENRCFDIENFIKEWDDPRTCQNRGDISINTSEVGNINIAGSAADTVSYMLTIHDERFYHFIEPGIRPLVRSLILRFNCITYSSCEGHISAGNIPHTYRHVGILPRDDNELILFESALQKMVSSANDITAFADPLNNVFIILNKNRIDYEGNRKRDCLDLNFIPIIPDEVLYFKGLTTSTEKMLECIRNRSFF